MTIKFGRHRVQWPTIKFGCRRRELENSVQSFTFWSTAGGSYGATPSTEPATGWLWFTLAYRIPRCTAIDTCGAAAALSPRGPQRTNSASQCVTNACAIQWPPRGSMPPRHLDSVSLHLGQGEEIIELPLRARASHSFPSCTARHTKTLFGPRIFGT